MKKATVKATKKKKADVQDSDLDLFADDTELDVEGDEELMQWLQSHEELGFKLKGELKITSKAAKAQVEELDENLLELQDDEDLVEELEELEEDVDDLESEDDVVVAPKVTKKRGGKKRKDPLEGLLPAQPLHEEGAENGYRQLVRFGRSRGWVTIAEINDLLPESALRSEEALSDITLGLARFGVQVFDQTPDEDTVQMLAEQQATVDEDIDEEDAATILTPEESAGLSKDPLRAYLRGVGSHKLLTREGEIEVAKSIEQHRARLVQVVLTSPLSIQELLVLAEKVQSGAETIDNVIDGFTDIDTEEIEDDSGDLNTDIGAAAMTVEQLDEMKERALEMFSRLGGYLEEMRENFGDETKLDKF